MAGKNARSVSIIGGADGPTSVFIAGKSKKTSLKIRIKNALYRRKRSKVEKTITANPHTLEEVVQYLQDTYGAVEVSQESLDYREQRKNLKEALIIQHKPELLGELGELKRPTDYDVESLQEFWNQLELRSKKAESIPDEMFSMDFHTYEINLPGVGRIQFDIDTVWDIFGSSYSGSKKKMKQLQRISKDVHLYYGVTEEDIEKRTQRYKRLLAALC